MNAAFYRASDELKFAACGGDYKSNKPSPSNPMTVMTPDGPKKIMPVQKGSDDIVPILRQKMPTWLVAALWEGGNTIAMSKKDFYSLDSDIQMHLTEM